MLALEMPESIPRSLTISLCAAASGDSTIREQGGAIQSFRLWVFGVFSFDARTDGGASTRRRRSPMIFPSCIDDRDRS